MWDRHEDDFLQPLGELMAEHDRLLDLDRHVRVALDEDDEATARGLFALLVALLEPHTAAEERGLFAVLGEEPELAPRVRELTAQHDRLHRRIEAAVGAGSDWPDLVRSILDQLYAHLRAEEFELFPRALELLDGAQWARVAAVRATDLTS